MKIINNYRSRYLIQDSDFKFPGHRHGKYEANILLEGKIELTCGDNVFSVEEGHFAIWKPGVFHMSRVASSDGASLISLEFDLDCDPFPSRECAIIKMNSDDLSLAQLIKSSSGEALIKLTEAFLIRLSDRESQVSSFESGLSDTYRKAVNYMVKNLYSNINVQSIARHCNVCVTTLKKAFYEYASTGVHSYFIEMKLHRAKELLSEGKGVSEVSDTLGFSSPAYFSQCFKSKIGKTPMEYKKYRA